MGEGKGECVEEGGKGGKWDGEEDCLKSVGKLMTVLELQ